MRRFNRNWSPVRFDQLEWRRWRDCELTNVMREFLRVLEEMVEGVWMIFEIAVLE